MPHDSVPLERRHVEEVARQLDAVDAYPARTMAVTQAQADRLGVKDGESIAGITVVVWEP